MAPETIVYRGHALTITEEPPHWCVTVAQPRAEGVEANLPVQQDGDRAAAIGRARDLVDELLDGRRCL